MADINQAARDKAAQNGQAMAGGRFPARNGVDLDNGDSCRGSCERW